MLTCEECGEPFKPTRGKKSCSPACSTARNRARNANAARQKRAHDAAALPIAATASLPIETSTLACRPCRIPLGAGLLEQYELDAASLLDYGCKLGRGEKKSLDVTTGDPILQERCANLATALVGERGQEALDDAYVIAELFGVNSGRGACGLFKPRNETSRHQHYVREELEPGPCPCTPSCRPTVRRRAPQLGVLNIGGGDKAWELWAPHETAEDAPMDLMQAEGDLIWVPPGWHHRVNTLSGPSCDRVASGFAAWLMPRGLHAYALLNHTFGDAGESQLPIAGAHKAKARAAELRELWRESVVRAPPP